MKYSLEEAKEKLKHRIYMTIWEAVEQGAMKYDVADTLYKELCIHVDEMTIEQNKTTG